MSQNSRRVERIRALQSKLHEIAAWRLAKLQREKTDMAEQQQAVLATLNEDTLGPLLVDLAARRLKTLAAEEKRIDAAAVAQSSRVQEERLRLERAGRMAEKVAVADRRQEEKTALDQILDSIAAKGHASFPPA